MSTMTGLERLLLRYRWIYVVPLVLPASKVFAFYQSIRGRARRLAGRRAHAHDRHVAAMQAAIRRWKDQGAPGLLCTARKDWESMALPQPQSYKKTNYQVPVTLYNILATDLGRRIVQVEPGVTMGQLTKYLIPAGWTLPVVPELEDLTVGGLVLGYGIETSSHRYGLFSDIIESCEVLLGDGTVVRASQTENPDLFRALPWSRGSLGFLTAVELRIIPAPPWVRLDYHYVVSAEQAYSTMARLIGSPGAPEFVEGLLFSADEGVIITGEFADRLEPGAINQVGRWYKPWFHEHARARGRRPSPECLPLRQYYHRHSRGIFWAAALLVPFGNHPVFRWPLGWLMPPKISFLKVTETDRQRQAYQDMTITQEGLVPIEHLVKTVEICHELFDAYPIWLCPAKLTRTDPPGLANPTSQSGAARMYVDVGVFFSVPGPVLRGEPWSARPAIRRFEAWLREHEGFPSTYAASDMTREEFRSTFDCQLYDQVRTAYHAENTFLDVYDKLKRP